MATTNAQCKTCGEYFVPKYEWQKQCWGCFYNSPQGRAWKERQDQARNGFKDGWNDSYGKDPSGQERWHSDFDYDDSERYRRQGEESARQKRAHDGRYRTAMDDELPFNKELLRKLIMLCHPDKHGGSEMSNNVTKELLKMKEKMR